MPSFTPRGQVIFGSLLSILLAQAPQNATPGSQARFHLTQDQMCCFTSDAVSPTYPRAARLAGIQGEVKLFLVIGGNNTIAELRRVSGDPVLAEAAMQAVRQWHFMIGGYPVGALRETEVPLTFTFKIEDAPKPAYLHLSDGKVIRADSVREFVDRMEYIIGGRTHYISPESVVDINACARISIITKPKDKENSCIPAGGPNFDIIAIPLLPARNTSHDGRPAAN